MLTKSVLYLDPLGRFVDNGDRDVGALVGDDGAGRASDVAGAEATDPLHDHLGLGGGKCGRVL